MRRPAQTRKQKKHAREQRALLTLLPSGLVDDLGAAHRRDAGGGK